MNTANIVKRAPADADPQCMGGHRTCGGHGGRAAATRAEHECQERAWRFLTERLGTSPDDLCWDATHHLQGHAHLEGQEYVIIASRDDEHSPVLLTVEDWEIVRRAPAEQRIALLRAMSIGGYEVATHR